MRISCAKFVGCGRRFVARSKLPAIIQGSHASWKVLESPGFFLVKLGPGKSWKNILENYAFFIGSNRKQAEIVNVPVCVDFYLLT